MNRLRLHSTRGFTLVEIIIIAALIALLSTIAIFQVASVMANVRRKTALADARTVADAITLARFDNNIYVKPGYLHLAAPLINVSATAIPQLKHDFDVMGYMDDLAGPPARRILDNWNGPYFQSPDTRSAAAPGGSGYVCEMFIMTGATSISVSWPADPWGNPYVVYLVKIDDLLSIDWISHPADDANYFQAVVSYGPNRIPGGSADTNFVSPVLETLAEDYMLYRKGPGPNQFIALDSTEYTTKMLTALNNIEFGYLGNDNVNYSWVHGILNGDPITRNGKYVLGSDDIIVPIR